MADIDFASLAHNQQFLLAAGIGLVGFIILLALGRKSYGPVPSACPPFP